MTEQTTPASPSKHKPFSSVPGKDAQKLLACVNDAAIGPKFKNAPLTTIYEVELITPLYGGGVQAGVNDIKLPIRAKALRGQLRFWWRLLATNGVFAAHGLPAGIHGSALYAAEAERWGGARDGGAPLASHIGVRIDSNGFGRPESYDQRGTDNRWRETGIYVDAGIKYALFPAKHDDKREPQSISLIPAGQHFKLKVSITDMPIRDLVRIDPEKLRVELNETIKWWATFGGIGARWRRGAGSVLVKHDGQTLCVVWAVKDSKLFTWPKNKNMFIGVCPPNPTALEAWKCALGWLRAFRQEPGIGRNGRPHAEGRSFWPEPDLVRDRLPAKRGTIRTHAARHPQKDWAPRAAFGMPLGIQFPNNQQRNNGEPDGGEVLPIDQNGKLLNRMASPLIIRAVALPNGAGYAPCALLLPQWRDVLGQQVALKHKWSITPLNPAPVDGIWPSDPVRQGAASKDIKPIDGTGKLDPLSAFMKFFTT